MKRIITLGLLSIALIFPAVVVLQNLNAQELSQVKGGLGGEITDNSGAVVPGAKVIFAGGSDKRNTTTDGSGRYVITGLTPGLYTVSVEMKGFKTAQAKNVEVVINRVSNLNLKLELGAATETVEVSANSVEVDTGSTAIGSNLDASYYSQVPVARNVGSLFYTAPGVADGGGTGSANPSIGGSTGLENQYVADGVSINDAGYGGLGVYSPSYGSLGTGINLSFIQEVQVKTGAFEPKYGKANGGIVQIVTKSGGSTYHGALAAYFAPDAMSMGAYYSDTYRAAYPSLQHGKVYAQPAYDASAELGGFIPLFGHHDKLFFFGAYNPSLNQVSYVAPNTPFSSAVFAHGPFTSSVLANNWAGKLTFKITDGTSIEGSAFGDPSRSNYAYNAEFADPAAYNPLISFNLKNTSAFSSWNYGSRSVVVRLNSAINATTQVSMAATAKTSHFTESGFQNIYEITDKTSGSTGYQGLGEFQNPKTNDYGFSIDAQKDVHFLGGHTFSIGWAFERTIYDSTRDYSGPHYNFPAANAAGTPVADIPGGSAGLAGVNTSAAFYLANAPATCTNFQLCPIYPLTGKHVYLRQVRGVYSSVLVNSSESYHVLYGNDNWALGRHLTFNLGIRWEEEQLSGPNQQYVFVNNWSPRLGVNYDPFGDRKSKAFFNWGRYTQALPTDAAIRELNQELDLQARWAAPSTLGGDGNYTLATNADGTITPILDAAHLLNGTPNSGYVSTAIVASPSTLETFSPGTKLNYEEEYVAGLEHQFKNGIVVSARYTDRRIKRIVEDMGGASPEGANAGVPQIFLIGNPNPKSDYFVNEKELKYATGDPLPAACDLDYGDQQDSLGNDLGSACGTNISLDENGNANQNLAPGDAAYPSADGIPDGFAQPVRKYQALEIEANKNFSHNFLLRANYRYAKLNGNYEGLFRNDNGQSDPGISSLFDFTTGILGLLGSQFQVGPLNTDRRSVGNLYGSYTLPSGLLKKLTTGVGLRGQSGTPINFLVSHPVYQNRGEIPIGGRGVGGRLTSTLQLDLHTDYPVSLGDKGKLKLAFDVFNVTDSRFITNNNQFADTGFQTGADPTYGSPTTFQRPFYGRGSIRFEF
jgi:hypothetical protein